VVTATGSLNVTSAITTFRAMLGEPSNSSAPGQQPSGRRELTLDGTPGDPFVNTNNFPPDFFNPFNPTAGYGLTRGSYFTTAGTGVRLSGNNFSDIDASYAAQFNAFTPPRTMAPVGSNVLNIHFQIAGAATPATVKGFGLVFSDVDQAGSTSLEFFSGHTSLGIFNAPVRSDANGFSFVGVQFEQSVVTHVKIRAGQAALGAGVKDVTDAGASDLVVFDNFMYSEPIPLTAITPTVIRASGTLTVTNAISNFRILLGGPDNGEATGQQTGGRREINWDTVPLTLTNVSTYPSNFFNTSSPRGLILAIPENTLRVSNNDFNDVNPTYGPQFNAFSAPKTAVSVGSNIVTVTFRVAGQNTPAAVDGFGLVFSDIDMPGSSSIELFNGNTSLGLFPAPARSDATVGENQSQIRY
jgi:hypothetical protein